MDESTDVRQSLASILERWRRREGLSKKEAALKLGVSPRSYADYAAGRTMPRSKVLRRIAETTGADSYEWMGAEGQTRLDEEIAQLRRELRDRLDDLDAELRRLRPGEETPSASN